MKRFELKSDLKIYNKLISDAALYESEIFQYINFYLNRHIYIWKDSNLFQKFLPFFKVKGANLQTITTTKQNKGRRRMPTYFSVIFLRTVQNRKILRQQNLRNKLCFYQYFETKRRKYLSSTFTTKYGFFKTRWKK